MKTLILSVLLSATAAHADLVSTDANGQISVITGKMQSLCVDSAAGACKTMKAGASVSDRVGIGTTSPATALDVNGTITATAISAPTLGDMTVNGQIIVTGTVTVQGNGLSVSGSTFTVGSTGNISAPSQAGAAVVGYSQSIDAAVDQKLYWGAVAAPGYVNQNVYNATTSSGTFTARGAGIYLFCVVGSFDASGTGRRILTPYLNGVAAKGNAEVPPGAATYGSLQSCVTWLLANGDTADWRVQQTSGGALTWFGQNAWVSFQKLW